MIPKVFRYATLFACVTAILLSPHAHAQKSNGSKRVVVLYWSNKDHPWNVSFDRAFQAVLRSAGTNNVEYFPEYLEPNRFPGEKQKRLLRDYLSQKYAEPPIDVVVANSDTSLQFLLQDRANVFPHAAIVFIATKSPAPAELAAGPGITGIVNLSAYEKTVDLALKLHPGTQHVYVISGTLEHDKKFEALARDQLSDVAKRVAITYLTDLPVHELIAKMKSLPGHSVVLYIWQQYESEPGTILESPDIFAAIVQSIKVPVYGLTPTTVKNGAGAIGGYLDTADRMGTRAAQITLRIASGTRAQDIPAGPSEAVPMFDWRQLKRWHIREDQLPQGAVVLFREPTFWQRYKWRIVGVISLFILQAILIAVLLTERRRRRMAMAALDERLRFEILLFELATELSRVRTSEVGACIAQWVERFGAFFQLENGAFVDLPKDDASATDARDSLLIVPVSGDAYHRALVYSMPDSSRMESRKLTMRLRVIGELFSESLTRRQQENELRTSEERFETAFRSNPQPMSLSTLSDDRYLDVNDSFLEISGLRKEEIIGRTSTELGFWPSPSNRDSFRDQLVTEKRVRNFEMKFRPRSGTLRDFLSSAELLDLGGQQCVLFAASDITDRKKLEDDLMQLTGRLFHLQDEERRRIARELHDETAQNLFGISMDLAKLRLHSAGWGREQVQTLEDCSSLADLSIREIRTLSYLLHPPLLDQAGLVAAVQWYVDGFIKRSEIPVELFVDDIGRLDLDLETALFRVVQEGLTNIHRHSGGAKASIRLVSNDGQVILEIRDDGHGIVSRTSSESPDGIEVLGVGIPGMRQRLRQLGGTLDVVSSDLGTIVTATAPMSPLH